MSEPSIQQYLPLLRSLMFQLRIPNSQDKVYKDECIYSFDSPFSDSGLYVNTLTLKGVGLDYLIRDSNKTGCKLYLWEKWQQVRLEEEESSASITKLAIGIEGGFKTGPKYEIIKENFVVIFPTEGKGDDGDYVVFPFPNPNLPEFISNVLQGIINHEGMKTIMQVTAWDADQEKQISKYAETLEQINPSGKKIPQNPKLWKDEASDATENLWLNLSTGYIGGGRRNYDGSGGSGSALQHYIDTGSKYPLVVKLGTITAQGADVWSYAPEEDGLVIDPFLAEHLSFWGIDAMKLEKTDKTLGEMEVDLNSKYDWSRIMEGQEKLELLSGPGLVGLRNIGSSCYLNSAMQCFLSIPEVQERYFRKHDIIVQTAGTNPEADLSVQLSKLAQGVLSDRYVAPVTSDQVLDSLQESSGDSTLLEKYVVAPRVFKSVVGKDHPDFSSGKQQDVSEYFSFFLERLSRDERVSLKRFDDSTASHIPTASIFEYHTEIKYKRVDSNEVKFSKHGQNTLNNILELPVPLNRMVKSPGTAAASATTTEASEDGDSVIKKPRFDEEDSMMIPLEACIEAWRSEEVVSLEHPGLGAKVPFVRSIRFRSFPRYLVIKLARYYVGENWVQKKITAEIPMPLELDLECLRGQGVLPGEEELGDEGNGTAVAAGVEEAFVVDEGLVAVIMSMGFSENGSRRAAIATRNADAETAMNWVFEHMGDSDFNDPPATAAPSSHSGAGQGPAVSDEAIGMLTSMGYTVDQCTAALIATDHNIERAADWLFSHPDDLDAAVSEILHRGSSEPTVDSSEAAPAIEDGVGSYSLFAIVSHIGKNTDHGHYVCHILKDGVWALFNDEKVGKSEKPPLGHGFLYFYRRKDGPATLDT